MEAINVFGGRGYVGTHFVNSRTDCIVNDRNDYAVYSNNIVYFISTNTNYNVFTNPFVDIDTNLTTLVKVLSNISDKENTVFNFISSWFVYGSTDVPAKETSHCNPRGFYSITKRTAEQLLISYCETFGIKYRILRLANVVGNGDKNAGPQKNAIVHLIQQIKQNQPVKLYEGGKLYRDVIGTKDCVRAINLILEKGELNTIYNIGNGQPIELADILTTAKRLFNSTSNIQHIETPTFHKNVQVKSMYMDNSKLHSLGYTQTQDLESIIQSVVED
jgi:nucleoside-diphosphate-sugar epimerase